jgi:hypothetical protein
MPRYYAIAACVVALSACATKPAVPVNLPPVAEPCPSEGLAPLKAEPTHPLADPVDRGKVYGAIASVIGNDRAQALVRFWETDEPTWGRQGWERVKRTKEWCDRR